MKNNIIFDLDGVLVDACDWHYESLNRALVEYNKKPISMEDHYKTFNGLPTKVKLQILNIDKKEAEEINHLKQKHTLDVIKNFGKVMEEKIELHRFLKENNFKICCVTNSIRETASKMLKVTGQYDYVDLLITNENVKRNKPHPDCYIHAMEILKTTPNDVFCVEDSDIGVKSAISANIKNLLIVKNTTEVNLKNIKKFINGVKE